MWMRKWLSTLAGGLLWEKAMPFCTFQWNVIITVCPPPPPDPPTLGNMLGPGAYWSELWFSQNWNPRIDTEPIQNTSNQISFSHSTFSAVPPLQVNCGWGLALIKIPPEQKASQICLMHNIQIHWSAVGWYNSQELGEWGWWLDLTQLVFAPSNSLPGMNKRNLFPIPFVLFPLPYTWTE